MHDLSGGPGPAELLGRVAAALTACDQAGLKVKLQHGAVVTRHGYVFRIGQEWAPRTRAYAPFAPADHDEDESP